MQLVTNLVSSNTVVATGRGWVTDHEVIVYERPMRPLEIVGFYAVIIAIGIAAIAAMWRLSRRKN